MNDSDRDKAPGPGRSAAGLLLGALSAVVLLVVSSGCQSISPNRGGPFAAFRQAEEPEAPMSLSEWMGMKRMDP